MSLQHWEDTDIHRKIAVTCSSSSNYSLKKRMTNIAAEVTDLLKKVTFDQDFVLGRWNICSKALKLESSYEMCLKNGR